MACETVTVPITAGLWSGGSRDLWFGVRLQDGAIMPLPGQDAAPWDNERRERTINIPHGFAMVLHSTFCGKDQGLEFHVNPADIAALLPAPSTLEISNAARVVLSMTSQYIPKVRREYAARAGVNAAAYDAGKAELISAGLMNGQGALTVKGRNAANAMERV